MILMRSNVILSLALAAALVYAGPQALAADEPQPAEPPDAANQQPAATPLVPVPESGDLPANLMATDQLIPTYECAPEENCVCRACMVGPEGQHWFRADYLLWWTRGVNVIPLVTTSNTADGGIIGNPTTQILFGNEELNNDSRDGLRLNFGWWLHCGRTAGIEFDFLSLPEDGTSFNFASTPEGQPLYARPFWDANPQYLRENAELVSHPDWLQGTVSGDVENYFHSAGVALRVNLCCHEPCCSSGCDECCEESCDEGCGCAGEMASTRAAIYSRGLKSLFDRCRPTRYRVDLIAGYRNYMLTDNLRVNEDLYVFAQHELIEPGTTIDLYDSFRTRNEFHGGELGLSAQFYRGCWSLELLAKMAMGNNSQVVTIYGETTTAVPEDRPFTHVGGLLALENTNIGRYTRNDFVVIPQFGAEIGYQLTCHLRAFAGYNFIYWHNVARAAEQVDYTVNSSYLPPQTAPAGEARPRFAWQDSDFWAQGMNFGFEFRF